MTKQKSKQFTADAAPDKTSQPRPLVQLTVTQLKAIAAGDCGDDIGCNPWECGHNHNETMVSTAQIDKAKTSISDKTSQSQPLVQLTVAQLESIAGAGISVNHNETVVKFPNPPQKQQTSSQLNLIKLGHYKHSLLHS